MTALGGVTVIAPCHNAQQSLPSFLVRLGETLGIGDRVVLVDDGSTDGTHRLLGEWVDGRSGATLIRLESNGGVAAARNRALLESTTDFVWFVDVDDEWEPRILRTLREEALRASADIVVCRALYRIGADRSGRVIDGLARRELVSSETALERMALGRMHGFLWNKLFRRSILHEQQFPLLSSQSDFVGVLRAVQEAQRVLFIPEVLYSYLYTASSITRRRNPDLGNLLTCAHEMDAALERVFDEVPTRLSDWFTTWFYAIPVALTPIRQNSDAELVRRGVALGSAALQDVHLLRSARRPRLLLLALVLKHAPVLFAALSRALFRIHDTARRVASRSGGDG
ncbi:glycosyltransferase family 2 protein [Rathayibacter sp. SD072]|uniref:glycosyltransferase family 2 protein n=1 Tax=Rathayibacter sp. SD072 TaxID=2781731 RepID=UPI001A9621F6|nr:glycosyltransferase family 2 protein [Rathayibacter sp. SD072]MBO0982869.1 glycosyltransferase family 2 protein [Rathayibacter sp. SD072]